MPPRDKLTRWLDLIAALLRRRGPASFDALRTDVPDYAASSSRNEASVLRTFERDKVELRSLGIAIETLADDAGSDSRYRLRTEAFYLPYLSICESSLPNGVTLRPDHVPDGIGYKSLGVCHITPDDRDSLRRAAARVRSLGNAALEDDAASAMRKLEFDLGLLPVSEPLIARHAVDSDVFEVLGAALDRRKRVTMHYRTMGRDQSGERVVEPYGLVFTTGHWYLVARDPAADGIRQFRVSRISTPQVNTQKPQQADYDIPETFDLQAHAASRQAWELGDGDAERVFVRFRGASGHVQQALRFSASLTADDTSVLPTATESPESLRVYTVRRRDPFLRWLLTFGGDARPIAPESAVIAWRDIVGATRLAQVEVFAVPSHIDMHAPLATRGDVATEPA